MFSKQASVLNEVISDFKSNYESQQTLEKREEHAKFSKAVDCLLAAASILDDVGLEAYADQIGSMLETVSWHVPTSDSAMSGLTPEKMEKNLTEKGWVFNADDGEILEVVEPGEVKSNTLPQLNDTDGTIEVEDFEEETKEAEPVMKEASGYSLTMAGALRFAINKINDNPGEWHSLNDMLLEYGLEPDSSTRATVGGKLRGRLGQELGIETYNAKGSFLAFRVNPNVLETPKGPEAFEKEINETIES